jgi:hypothetical protein
MKLITMNNNVIVSVQEQDYQLREMLALNDAVKILEEAKTATCRDALPIFSKVNNAQKHLNKQIALYLGE